MDVGEVFPEVKMLRSLRQILRDSLTSWYHLREGWQKDDSTCPSPQCLSHHIIEQLWNKLLVITWGCLSWSHAMATNSSISYAMIRSLFIHSWEVQNSQRGIYAVELNESGQGIHRQRIVYSDTNWSFFFLPRNSSSSILVSNKLCVFKKAPSCLNRRRRKVWS